MQLRPTKPMKVSVKQDDNILSPLWARLIWYPVPLFGSVVLAFCMEWIGKGRLLAESSNGFIRFLRMTHQEADPINMMTTYLILFAISYFLLRLLVLIVIRIIFRIEEVLAYRKQQRDGH